MRGFPTYPVYVFLLLGLAPRVEAVSTYTCTTVAVDVGQPFPGGGLIFPTSINNQEDVAGIWFGNGLVGFAVDQAGVSLPYTQPAGSNVNQAAVNNRGQIAGWFGANSFSAAPAQGFISNPDGSIAVLEPPADTPTQSFGNIWVNSINDNGEVLGQIEATDQNKQQLVYWFIRSAGASIRCSMRTFSVPVLSLYLI